MAWPLPFWLPQPDAWPSCLVGWHEDNARLLQHLLQVNKRVDPGPGPVLKSAHRVWRNAGRFCEVADSPAQSDPSHAHLETRDHGWFLRQQLIEAFPRIDDETLHDTLEGITTLEELIAETIRSALLDASFRTGLNQPFGVHVDVDGKQVSQRTHEITVSPSSTVLRFARRMFKWNGALWALGKSSSTIAIREKTAVISKNGTSTTIKFMKVVMSSSGTSL